MQIISTQNLLLINIPLQAISIGTLCIIALNILSPGKKYIPGNDSLLPAATAGQRIARERIAELDVLRGMAFLAVVLQHSLGAFIARPNISMAEAAMMGMLLHFTKFAVPAFIFAAGVSLFYNYPLGVSYPGFIKKRLLDIFLPYFLWTILYHLFLYGPPVLSAAWLTNFSKALLLGTTVYHLWFVVMIFQFYLAYPAFLKAFVWTAQKVTRTRQAVALMAGLGALYAGLLWFSASYIPARDLHISQPLLQLFMVEYRDRNFIYFIYYFILGGLAGSYLSSWRRFAVTSVGWNSVIFIVLFTLVGYELLAGAQGASLNFNYSTPLKPSMFLYCLSQIVLLYGLSMALVKYSPHLHRLLELMGKLSYGAYLCHAMLLTLAVRFVSLVLPGENYLVSAILSFIVCAFLSAGLTGLLGALPFGKYLTGPIKLPWAARDRERAVNVSDN